MRYLCLVLVLIGMPLPAAAQHASPAARPATALGAIGLPLPPVSLPPPSANLPPSKWDRVQTPSWVTPQVPWWERQPPPAWERPVKPTHPVAPPNHRPRPPSYVYGPVYPWTYTSSPPYPAAPPPPAEPPPPEPEVGVLRLDVEPAELLQIFVDGAFIGTPGDLGREIAMRPGARRIEIRAAGHETLVFNARIEAGRTITYRGELTSIVVKAPAPPPVFVPAGSQTLYVIPGCYLGNVPPDPNRLPARCDIGRMKTVTP